MIATLPTIAGTVSSTSRNNNDIDNVNANDNDINNNSAKNSTTKTIVTTNNK